MIEDVNDLRPLLGAEMCEVWKDAAEVINPRNCRLMGGTAIVAHIGHRPSFDLDFMSSKTFNGKRLARQMQEAIPEAVVLRAHHCWANVDVRGVQVQVFCDRAIGGRKIARWLAPGRDVSGIMVGSLPDLFASKLLAVTRRQTLRDFADLVALDDRSGLRLEDAIGHYAERYGASEADVDHLVRILDVRRGLDPDRALGVTPEHVASVLRARAVDLRSHIKETHRGRASSSTATARRATGKQSTGKTGIVGGDRGRCGHWMPRAGKRCVLPSGHAGPHRSRR